MNLGRVVVRSAPAEKIRSPASSRARRPNELARRCRHEGAGAMNPFGVVVESGPSE
jgi:hypothetical protein